VLVVVIFLLQRLVYALFFCQLTLNNYDSIILGTA